MRGCRWVPWIFVAGMLAVIGANAVLIYFAISSWSGLAVARPYERGIGYNRVLAAAAKQDALGWRLELVYEASATPLEGELVLRARDSAGQSLRSLDATVELTRPLEASAPIQVIFRPTGDATYAAPLEWPRPGQWQARVRVVRGADTATLTQRIVVK